jgi:hypothetical protein
MLAARPAEDICVGLRTALRTTEVHTSLGSNQWATISRSMYLAVVAFRSIVDGCS